jgi:hypothetical protein
MKRKDNFHLGAPWVDSRGRVRVPEQYFTDAAGNELWGAEAMDAVAERHWDFERFFTKRGIDPEVAAERGYHPWFFWLPDPLYAAWPVQPRQRGWRNQVAQQSGGLIMPRYVPPGINALPIVAEVRPFEPVNARGERYQRYREARGLDRKLGKYLLFPTPWKTIIRDGKPIRVKDRKRAQAKRIDMLPSTAPLFESAKRCFYVLEGVPKTDAIRSADEPACGVPAVSHWRAPELDQVIERYFRDKLVVLVVDSDHRSIWQVRMQSIQAYNYLRGKGLNVVVAAPPPTFDGEVEEKVGVDDHLGAGRPLDDLEVCRRVLPPAFTEWAMQRRGKGAANEVAVLQALVLCAGLRDDPERPEGEGELRKSAASIAAVINSYPGQSVHRRSVDRALERLQELSVITVTEGSLAIVEKTFETEDGVFVDYDFDSRPLITIAPEFRAIELEPIRLGEITSNAPMVEEFVSWSQIRANRALKESGAVR